LLTVTGLVCVFVAVITRSELHGLGVPFGRHRVIADLGLVDNGRISNIFIFNKRIDAKTNLFLLHQYDFVVVYDGSKWSPKLESSGITRLLLGCDL
jgi:hypothetical protein